MDAHRSTRRPSKARIARPAGEGTLVPFPHHRSTPPKAALPAIPPPDPSFIRDSYASTALAEIIDRSVHAATARFTVGLSPMALMGSYMDWAAHLAFAPGKQAQLAEKAYKKWMRLANYAGRSADPVRRQRTVHPAIAAGPSFHRRRLADAALRCHVPGIPARPAVVAQRDDRRARRQQAQRGHGRLRDAAIPRRLEPVELGVHQSRGALAHPAGRRDEPDPRLAQFRRGSGARDGRQEAGRRRGVRSRPQCGDHAGQGRLPQPADRADPVRADHRQGAAGAGADRAGVDHEVLHPRPEPGKFAGPLPDGAGPHRVHDLVEEPGPRGSRPVAGGLPHAGRDGRARRGHARSFRARRCTRSAIASAAPCWRSPRPRWRATATSG